MTRVPGRAVNMMGGGDSRLTFMTSFGRFVESRNSSGIRLVCLCVSRSPLMAYSNERGGRRSKRKQKTIRKDVGAALSKKERVQKCCLLFTYCC